MEGQFPIQKGLQENESLSGKRRHGWGYRDLWNSEGRPAVDRIEKSGSGGRLFLCNGIRKARLRLLLPHQFGELDPDSKPCVVNR